MPEEIKNSEVPSSGSTGLSIEQDQELINLASGFELKDADCHALAIRGPINLVVAAGPVGCGKTTMLTSLMDLFQSEGMPDHIFSWCHTLRAFERSCHLSREASGGENPDTGRTPFEDPKYLHLRVSAKQFPSSTTDLLFTDVSGEAYERARDSDEDCKKLTFLKRASHLLLFIDSKKLADPENRWSVSHESQALLRMILDVGMLAKDCIVTLVWAKTDCIRGRQEEATLREIQKSIQREFEQVFQERVAELHFMEIAARPHKTSDLKFGTGIAALLSHWTKSVQINQVASLGLETSLAKRESEKFLARYFPKDK